MTAVHEGTPFILLLVEQYVPVLAAFLVTIVLARQGFSSRLQEYRKDTIDLIRLRSETLERQLNEAHGEILQLQKEAQLRERRIRHLENEVDELREHNGWATHPRRGARRADPEPNHDPDPPHPKAPRS